MALRLLAILATRGTSNNLFQVATLVRAATALELEVQVLFADAALLKLRRDRINRPEWAPAYAAVQDQLAERLLAADFTDMDNFLREAKEHGDDAHFWACADTLGAAGLELTDLTDTLDGARPRAEFLRAAAAADALLEF